MEELVEDMAEDDQRWFDLAASLKDLLQERLKEMPDDADMSFMWISALGIAIDELADDDGSMTVVIVDMVLSHPAIEKWCDVDTGVIGGKPH